MDTENGRICKTCPLHEIIESRVETMEQTIKILEELKRTIGDSPDGGESMSGSGMAKSLFDLTNEIFTLHQIVSRINGNSIPPPSKPVKYVRSIGVSITLFMICLAAGLVAYSHFLMIMR